MNQAAKSGTAAWLLPRREAVLLDADTGTTSIARLEWIPERTILTKDTVRLRAWRPTTSEAGGRATRTFVQLAQLAQQQDRPAPSCPIVFRSASLIRHLDPTHELYVPSG